jgi:hypothetical protein
MRTAAWAITDFLSAVERVCLADKQSRELRMYFYAATESGWKRIRKSILNWRKSHDSRVVTAYIGTDHALTDAAALEAMQSEGVEVRLMRHYRGTFHPKVIWFVGNPGGTIIAGSNNLTEDGLRNNIEFATVTALAQVDANLQTWHDEIQKASEPATVALINTYAKEKEKYGQRRATSGQGGEFTWSKRTSGASVKKTKAKVSAVVGSGGPGLILEVMPRETSEEGRQVQIPLAVARKFFGLSNAAGSRINLELSNSETQELRRLVFTLNRNSTARLSIRELEYSSRPCVLIFNETQVQDPGLPVCGGASRGGLLQGPATRIHAEAISYRVDPGQAKKGTEDLFSDSGFKNADLALTDLALLDNIQQVQRGQNLPVSETLVKTKVARVNLDVEMETGTGKTYCYIKTIFELNRRYGWSKFIIVVPSIAIREGVAKSLEITAEHFLETYQKKARFFIYNSKQLHHLESFSSDAGINVMVINVQAFAARGADNRRIYEVLDDFQSRRPIDVISANRPILILDEPQKMEGAQTLKSWRSSRP